MKSVLISIRPEWCELIATGEKTVEVRKTKPNIDVPFKVYIYCTADRRKHIDDTYVPQTPLFVKNGKAKISIGREDGFPWKLGNGKVIGEFVCDKVDGFTHFENCVTPQMVNVGIEGCLTLDELAKYFKGNSDGYAWHISDLVIYEQPKELSEFHKPIMPTGLRYEDDAITRPPQSWCYVEEANR